MKNLLIIDDEELFCQLIERIAQKHFHVTIAGCGEAALKLLESDKRFDAIVLDLILPHISGWEILTFIRNHPFIRDVPVVIMTGCTISKAEKERLQPKVSAIIHKNSLRVEEVSELFSKLISTTLRN